MGDDIEIKFRGGNPKKWHSGKMNIEEIRSAQNGKLPAAFLCRYCALASNGSGDCGSAPGIRAGKYLV
jgi:hypothetical protein